MSKGKRKTSAFENPLPGGVAAEEWSLEKTPRGGLVARTANPPLWVGAHFPLPRGGPAHFRLRCHHNGWMGGSPVTPTTLLSWYSDAARPP